MNYLWFNLLTSSFRTWIWKHEPIYYLKIAWWHITCAPYSMFTIIIIIKFYRAKKNRARMFLFNPIGFPTLYAIFILSSFPSECCNISILFHNILSARFGECVFKMFTKQHTKSSKHVSTSLEPLSSDESEVIWQSIIIYADIHVHNFIHCVWPLAYFQKFNFD